MARSIGIWTVCLVLAGVWIGCSKGNTQPATGTVKLSDGTAVTNGEVIFMSNSANARGVIQSDGSFKLASPGLGEGVPPGKYKVYFLGVEDRTDPKAEHPPLLLDRKYYSAETTPLEYEVKPGQNAFEVKVEKAGPEKTQ